MPAVSAINSVASKENAIREFSILAMYSRHLKTWGSHQFSKSNKYSRMASGHVHLRPSSAEYQALRKTPPGQAAQAQTAR